MADDFSTTWTIMLASVFIALGLGFVFTVLIRFCGGVITWLFVIAFNLMLLCSTVIFAAAYFGYNSDYMQKTLAEKAGGTNADTKNAFLAAFIIFLLLTILSLVVTVCSCSKIKLAIGIMKTSAIFIEDNPMSILLPFFNIIAVLLYLCWWMGACIYLYSTGERIQGDKLLPFGNFDASDKIDKMQIFHFVSLLWNLAFLMASMDFILCSATCIWYF